ncbi:tumor necrosis factor receptor superfamily member 14-like isoform X2 [Trichosurus vulpecula]|uniref:tumor necrosis factor receptor superfamily member 14-like isoform X2 n=1 Tax=Trichosurus vulpecula TaxID=9337 RepID=UPI00186B314F|nr:tumor necrosis factor receptor superfamily member 14-like isoform X2 [Trichosurus vulpecula]
MLIFSMFIMIKLIRSQEALECMMGEYEVDEKCCYPCDPESGFMTRWECSSTSNTVCGCSPGHFCANMKDDDCETCVRHRVCDPGQYMKSRGTERNNTNCEKCQAGTFSPNGTLGQCLPWTNCTAQGLFEEKPGTDTKDELCSPYSNYQLTFIIIPFIAIVVIAVIAAAAIILVVKLVRRKKNQADHIRADMKDDDCELSVCVTKSTPLSNT